MPDVFGLTRRTVESLDAQADAARYQMLAVYTTLVNNLVATAVQDAATEAQIDATQATDRKREQSRSRFSNINRTRAMPAAWIWRRKNRNSPRPRPPCRL